MSTSDLDSLDPLPYLLTLLALLRNSPEDVTSIAIESNALKSLLKKAREAADAIPDADVSCEEQSEIIEILESRVARKQAILTRLSADGVEGPREANVKVELEDVSMTE